MHKRLRADLLARVQIELAAFPDGAAIEELSGRLASLVSRRSLQRKLAEWIVAGHIRAEGSKKGRRYFLPVLPAGRKIIAPAVAAPQPNSSSRAPTNQC